MTSGRLVEVISHVVIRRYQVYARFTHASNMMWQHDMSAHHASVASNIGHIDRYSRTYLEINSPSALQSKLDILYNNACVLLDQTIRSKSSGRGAIKETQTHHIDAFPIIGLQESLANAKVSARQNCV